MTKRIAAYSNTYPKGGVSCSTVNFLRVESSVTRTNFCTEKAAHHQSGNRYLLLFSMKVLFSISLALFLYSCQIDVEVGTQSGTEYPENHETNSKDPDQANLYLTTENALLWNELQLDTAELQDSIINFISKSIDSGHNQIELDSIGNVNQTCYLITISKEKMTSDEFYTRISKIINISIETVRDEKSQLIYKSPFIELSEDQQSNMRQVVQTCVIEYTTPK
jgi:hypothetical protein